MAEVNEGNKIKVIAFYLPQFHEIPENDQWWGKGFTEWDNVKKANPLFPGQDQPRVPLNNNYYNLLDDNVKIWQADLAAKYEIFGFCYYHYWFQNGKKLLEKPAEQMLRNKEIRQPFCFCWANENWSRNWDGGNREVIMKQEYGNEKDWEEHFRYLLPFFRDDRYITVEGKPLFVIYKPDQIADIYQMAGYFRRRTVEEGFPGLCLAFQFPTYYMDMYYRDDVFDYMIEFEPVFSRSINSSSEPGTSSKVKLVRKLFGEDPISAYRKKKETAAGGYTRPKHLSMFFYDEAWEHILKFEDREKLLPGGFVDWDNTPRNKHGVVYSGFSIEKFEQYMLQLLQKARSTGKNMVFLNAWNEWGEGAYLEPDEHYGYRRLEAIQRAVRETMTE